MNVLRRLFAISLLLVMSDQALAHHSWAAIFDTEGDIEIDGVVSKIVWRNPHIQLEITTNQGTGSEKVWVIESNSVASLTRMGVSKDLLALGTPVKVAGYPQKDADNGIFMNHLLLPDQTELIFLRTAKPRWEGKTIGSAERLHGGVVEDDFAKRPNSIFAVWNTIYGAEGSHRSLGQDEIQWTDHAMAFQAAQKAAGITGVIDRHDCSPRDFRTAMGAPYPIQIIDQGDSIAINAEFFDTYRTVHMNATELPAELPKDNLGYSTGHWVGDTLVVETLLYREGGVEGDDFMQVHETFSLAADHNRLGYTRVIVDPLMREVPTIEKKWWQYQPGAFVQPYNCSP